MGDDVSSSKKHEDSSLHYESLANGATTPPTTEEAGTPLEKGNRSTPTEASEGPKNGEEKSSSGNTTPSGGTEGVVKETAELTVGGIPEKDPGVESRGAFSNRVQYLLACIGYAVGLGNIWRFPSVAYANGGGAFLLPYLIVAMLFGLPTLYIECALGQFTQYGPSKAFKFYLPISQGIGWAQSVISLSIALYYNVICAWTMIYLGYTIVNKASLFSSCDNYWNTWNCTNTLMCEGTNTTRFFNGQCYSEAEIDSVTGNFTLTNGNVSFVAAPDEFFTHYITQKHLSFDFGGFNWKVAGCLIFCWALTALGLVKGVKWLGRISMVTATIPYFIVVVLLVRGVTLPGASVGIEYYLTRPDFSKMFTFNTWKAALTQLCFSLSVGQGGMLAMSSYNKRSHKCFKDAVIVMFADSIMSIIGGVAVFSVLGFMASISGKTIDEVVPSPLSLAFVAYPEAISHMPKTGIIVWYLLFFFMLFMLGISTMFGLVEGFITCLCDSVPWFRARHAITVIGTCSGCCLIGLFFFCAQNGYHFFAIFNEYIGSFSLAVVIFFEIIVVLFVYGPRKFFRDMESQFGRPTSQFFRIFGPQGIWIKTLMCTAPIFSLGVLFITLYDLRNVSIFDKIGITQFEYPSWAVAFGLLLAAVPLSTIPIFAIVNCIAYSKTDKGISGAFQMADNHPSLRYKLDPPPAWFTYWQTPLADTNQADKSEFANKSPNTSWKTPKTEKSRPETSEGNTPFRKA